jgi:hypothetical protein
MGIAIRHPSWLQKAATHIGLVFIGPFMRQEQAFNWL